MKKLFTLLVITSLAFTIQAQHITNKLGSSGKFYINDDQGVTNFEFTHDIISYPELKIGKDVIDVGQDAYMFRIQNAGIGPAVSIENVGTGTPALFFHKSDSGGKIDGKLGEISFSGYDGIDQWRQYAGIQGSLSASGGSLSFLTGDTSLATQLFINFDGKVGIGEISPTSTLDVDGSVALAYTTGGSVTLDDTHYTYVTSIVGATVTLPDAVGIAGRIYTIKSTVGSPSGKVTVNTTSSQNIDGDQDYELNQWKYVKVQSTGVAWIIIGQN